MYNRGFFLFSSMHTPRNQRRTHYHTHKRSSSLERITTKFTNRNSPHDSLTSCTKVFTVSNAQISGFYNYIKKQASMLFLKLLNHISLYIHSKYQASTVFLKWQTTHIRYIRYIRYIWLQGYLQVERKKELNMRSCTYNYIRSLPETLLKHQAKHIECLIQVPRRCGIERVLP